MTLQELQNIFLATDPLVMNAEGAVSNLVKEYGKMRQMVFDPNFSSTLNVDQFVTLQLPIWQGLLMAYEAAGDLLGTDGLKP